MHPLLAANNYNSDIRQDFPAKSFLSLQIPALKSGSITIPYVGFFGDRQAPFQYPIVGGELIGGVNGNEYAGMIPCKTNQVVFLGRHSVEWKEIEIEIGN